MADAPDVFEQALAGGNRWLIRLRWLAAAGIVACTLFAAGPLGYPVPTGALLALAVAVAAYNAVLNRVERRLSAPGEGVLSRGRALANAQIILDLVAVAALVHLAGGIGNPFAIYFLFHMIIASILLPPEDAYGQAVLASALYTAVILGESAGLLAHYPVFAERAAVLTRLDTAGYAAVMVSALLTTVYLTTTITRKLRQRERQLSAALGEVSRNAVACELAHADLQRTQEMQLRYMRRVSHELRAPLSSVGMSLRVIRDGLAGDVPERIRDMIGRAEARTETMLDLVGDLLTLSKMREAPLQEEMREVGVAELVRGVVGGLADLAEAKGVALRTEAQDDLPGVRGQPEGLRTMLANLVGNAIKYTPAGGTVTVSAHVAEGRGVELCVSDTGVGIAAAELPRLFEEFYRTESARQSQVHGTGLGLSIVKLIVETHRGEIRVDSEVGKGSSFTVCLPITQPGSGADEESSGAEWSI